MVQLWFSTSLFSATHSVDVVWLAYMAHPEA